MSKRKTLALIGEDAPRAVVEALEQKGFRTFLLNRDPQLPLPVSSHADMLLFCADDKFFITEAYASSSPRLGAILEEYGYEIILSNSVPDNFYPKDILFNMALIGNNVIGNIPFCDSSATDHLSKNGYKLCSVKQGYAKCSTAIIGDKAIITADKNIKETAHGLGIDVLMINNSEAIKLDGYDYGFIGGACGYYDGTLYFCGDIALHPAYPEISAFCKKHSTLLCSLSNEQLYDVGSILFLERIKG